MAGVDYVTQVAEIEGVKLGNAAFQACGMQQELAAHMMLQSQSMGISVILRAGSPPVYNQKRGPKTGFNLSKTSTQGLFRGSLAADAMFTRIDPKTGHGKGHDPKDAKHLELGIHEPDYQHTVPLPVTMQDILREVGPTGDLKVLGYEDGKLRLAYKEGRGDSNFMGQFVLDLNAGDPTPMFYSRVWDRPDHHPNWNKTAGIINKPPELAAIPDDVYSAVFNQSFTVNYTHTQTANIQKGELHSANVFANTPRTSADLRNAILTCDALKGSVGYQAVLDLDANNLPDRRSILALLSEDQIKTVYDSCALVTTGDWDGLALGQPPSLMDKFPHPEQMRVYNTFSVEEGRTEKRGLVEASCAYFDYLKAMPETQGTPLGELLATIDDPHKLFSEFAVDRAGCITPHEFLYEQLINYSYRDEVNNSYGDKRGLDAMQAGMDAALEMARTGNFSGEDKKYEECFQRAVDVYMHHLRVRRSSTPEGSWIVNDQYEWKKADQEHLASHLKMALDAGAQTYRVPNISHDHNVHDLFQHGFDMRNPYGSNLEGAWLMITNEGLAVYGDTQEQLTDALLIKGFLENNVITVSHGADMSAGWGAVVARQIQLEQPVSFKTMTKYNAWMAEEKMALGLPPTTEEATAYDMLKAAEKSNRFKGELAETVAARQASTSDPSDKMKNMKAELSGMKQSSTVDDAQATKTVTNEEHVKIGFSGS